MNEEKAKHRFSLAAKLNLVTIIMILAVSAGLLFISYFIQAKRVSNHYYEHSQEVAVNAAGLIEGRMARHMKECVDTEEFARVREKAVSSGDESLIIDWMKQKPGYLVNESVFRVMLEDPSYDESKRILYSLYADYDNMCDYLSLIMNDSEITYAYLQYIKDGVFYTLADPDLGPLGVGKPDEDNPEFAAYMDHYMSIPPTVYNCSYGWLCTSYEPVIDPVSGLPCATAGVDIGMDKITHERHEFLVNSIVLVMLLTAVAILINLYLIRRIAVKPLRLLTDATCGFAEGDQGYSLEDVIEVDIHSNDEISDLYHEIRSMQTRMVRYTDEMSVLTSEKARVSTELQLAARIQHGMLQTTFPVFPDRDEFELYASMDPAREVGGDFYDFYLLDEDHLALTIADVSGKGIPGALYMMSSMILLRTVARKGGTPAEILQEVNNQLTRNSKVEAFVTVWFAILDIRTGVVTCANAGHEYPVYSGPDGYTLLEDKHGLVIGGMEGTRYTDYEIRLTPGDILFVYTDGVPEASNSTQEFYSTDRMMKALNTTRPDAPQKVLETVRKSVDEFTMGAEQFDDLTMLCIKYKGNV
ncbi:MAG: SpoIIE family protein phosphatase [Lachnospiraceae bacterium]|nr:SpoIIE family protein phosphatase [Lachnospiraceae bacterium]